jgi:hypothetical protein
MNEMDAIHRGIDAGIAPAVAVTTTRSTAITF